MRGRDLAGHEAPDGGGLGKGQAPELSHLGEFQRRVYLRLRKGAAEYGDRSFTNTDPAALLREIQEELEDVAGWGFILWTRLERTRKALENMEAEHGNGTEKS